MPPRLEEITIVFIAEKWRRDNFAISTARPAKGANGNAASQSPGQRLPATFSILGESDPAEFQPQCEYRLWGRWETTGYGLQFKFDTFVVAAPHSKHGIIEYLKRCRNIGEAIAATLWEEFGTKAVEILRTDPAAASQAVGVRFPLEKAREAAEDLQGLRAVEDVTIELTDLLHGRGWPKGTTREAIRMWGNRAVEVLRRDPYKAMVFRGVGFKRADAFYLDLGKDPAKLKRQAYCVTFGTLKKSDEAGHVWIPLAQAKATLSAQIGGTTVTPEKAVELATRGKILTVYTDRQGQQWAADARRAAAEEYVVRKIVEAFER